MFSASLSIGRYLAVFIALACGLSGPARAAKLDGVTCDALKAERARLETEAIKSDMVKGPQWAKDNMSSERLKEIEQLIGLQESIAFRCPLPKPPPPPPGSVAKVGDTGKIKAASKKPDDSLPDDSLNGADGDKAPARILKKLPTGANSPVGQAAVEPPSAKLPSSKSEKPAASAKKSSGAGQKPNKSGQKQNASGQKQKAKVSDAFVAPPPAIGGGFGSGAAVTEPKTEPAEPQPATETAPALSP